MNTTLKLSDMGTTGLIDYVLTHPAGRLRAMASGRAKNVLRRRGYPDLALFRFSSAVAATGMGRKS